MKFKLWMLVIIVIAFFIISCSFAALIVRAEIRDPFFKATHQVEFQWLADSSYELRTPETAEWTYIVFRRMELRIFFRKSLPGKVLSLGFLFFFFSLFLTSLYFAVTWASYSYSQEKAIKALHRQLIPRICFGCRQSYTEVHEVEFLDCSMEETYV